MSAPFAHLVVLELASVLAGPSVGQFFAEGGATVLKLENPRTRGDVTRRWHLITEDPADDRPAYFASVNWGKQSVAVDLTAQAGREVLHALARKADVVVASYRPGQAEALGADAATLRTLSPHLIVAEITGYGPDDARPGYDAVIQAEAGFTFLNGEPDGPPVKLPVALMDVLAAHQLKEGILTALLQRERTGEGAHVTVSLLSAGVASLANQASNWLTAGVAPQRMGSAHPNIAPYGTLYPTANGDVVLAVGTDQQFAALCTVLDLNNLTHDPRFATNAARVRHRDALNAALAPALAARPRTELIDALAAKGVPAGAVRDVPAVFEQSEAERLILHKDGLGAVRTIAYRLNGGELSPLSPPPHYAADTRAVLGGRLGLDATALEELATDGTIVLTEGE